MQIAAELDVSQVMLHRATFSCFFMKTVVKMNGNLSMCGISGRRYVEFFLSFSLLFSIIRQKCGTTEMRGDTPITTCIY